MKKLEVLKGKDGKVSYSITEDKSIKSPSVITKRVPAFSKKLPISKKLSKEVDDTIKASRELRNELRSSMEDDPVLRKRTLILAKEKGLPPIIREYFDFFVEDSAKTLGVSSGEMFSALFKAGIQCDYNGVYRLLNKRNAKDIITTLKKFRWKGICKDEIFRKEVGLVVSSLREKISLNISNPQKAMEQLVLSSVWPEITSDEIEETGMDIFNKSRKYKPETPPKAVEGLVEDKYHLDPKFVEQRNDPPKCHVNFWKVLEEACSDVGITIHPIVGALERGGLRLKEDHIGYLILRSGAISIQSIAEVLVQYAGMGSLVARYIAGKIKEAAAHDAR